MLTISLGDTSIKSLALRETFPLAFFPSPSFAASTSVENDNNNVVSFSKVLTTFDNNNGGRGGGGFCYEVLRILYLLVDELPSRPASAEPPHHQRARFHLSSATSITGRCDSPC